MKNRLTPNKVNNVDLAYKFARIFISLIGGEIFRWDMRLWNGYFMDSILKYSEKNRIFFQN